MGILEQALAAAEAERAADEANRRADEARRYALALADLQSQAHEWGVEFDPADMRKTHDVWAVEVYVGRGCAIALTTGVKFVTARNGGHGDRWNAAAYVKATERVTTLAQLGRFIQENGQDE